MVKKNSWTLSGRRKMEQNNEGVIFPATSILGQAHPALDLPLVIET
jgi:hypothetical protein